MAVVHYHIHRARPKGFADPSVPVIRLMLEPITDTGVHAVWLFRRGRWTTGRYGQRDDGRR